MKIPAFSALIALLLCAAAHADMVALDDDALSQTTGQEGISMIIELQLRSSLEYQQTQPTGESNGIGFSQFVVNGTGIDAAGQPSALIATDIDATADGLMVTLKAAQFSVGVKDFQTRQGIQADGSANNVSRFGSVYALNFDISKSYVLITGH